MNWNLHCLLPAVVLAASMAGPLAARAQRGPEGAAMPSGQPNQATPQRAAEGDPAFQRTYIPLGRARALLYTPSVSSSKSSIGILVMHSHEDYLTFSACSELSKRGYTVLCAAGAGQGLDSNLLEAKAAMNALKKLPGIRKTILFGHSGGATLMTAYQEIAENGPRVCQGPEKIIPCGDNLAGLQPADAVVLADANWGNAVMALFSIDPAVLDDEDGSKVDPALNLWNPANGFNPNGLSDYGPEFIQRFQKGTALRSRRLLDKALARLAVVQAGKGRFADDEPFVIAGAGSLGPNNKLFSQDPKLLAHTVKPWPQIHADGSIVTEIVQTVRPPQGSQPLTSSLNIGAINTTVRSYLKNSAIRVSDDYGFDDSSVRGVVWNSSYSTPIGNAENIHVPLLLMGMTGSWEFLASESIYNHAASQDKSLVFVQGANHVYAPCKQCEKTPGQFGDTLKLVYDYVDRWIATKNLLAN